MEIMSKENSVVITSAVRTAIGDLGGSLKNVPAYKLGSTAISNAIKKSNLKPSDVNEIIMGQVLTAGAGQNPARQAALNAGIPISKPAHIINQVCGSGLRAVISGYQSIKLGEASYIIAGGQESMSMAPHSIFYRNEKKFSEKKFFLEHLEIFYLLLSRVHQKK